MFQISTSPRAAVSALTVLAAIGTSGMASQVVAATTTYEPTTAARVSNGVNYGNFASQWDNTLDNDNWLSYGGDSRGFFDWGLNLGTLDNITHADLTFVKISEGVTYGTPDGSHIAVALVTQEWQSTYLNGGTDANNVQTWGATGPSVANELIFAIDPDNDIFTVDVTPLLEIWQAAPSSYYGLRFYVTDAAGGIGDPNSLNYAPRTGELVLTTEAAGVPEPATLSVLLAGSAALCLSRRRRL